MEKGEIRFHGPTAELLERPDVLRSVFLEGAQARAGSAPPTVPATATRVEPPHTNGQEEGVQEEGERAIRLSLDRVTKRFGGVTALSEGSVSPIRGEIAAVT